MGGWVTGAGESGVGEVLVATSLIARSLFWFKFQMEFVFWDCGSTQVVVAKQSGEVCIVHGDGAAERFRGEPWDFREGLLHRSAERVRPADLFKWDVELGGDMALSLKHHQTESHHPFVGGAEHVRGQGAEIARAACGKFKLERTVFEPFRM